MWCKLHHLPTIEAKRAAKQEQWGIDNKEQNRLTKGELFDEAMAAVKLLTLVCSGVATNKNSLITALEKARVIMEKAKDLK